MDIDGNYIRNRLIELRMNKDVSAQAMSLFLGQSRGYITAIETGYSLPSMTVFLNICDYLCISPKEFFDTDLPVPEKYREVSADIKKLSSEQLAALSIFVKSMIK